MSADGYTMNPADIAAVAANKETKPRTVGTLPKLLVFISSYHQYICDFSRLAKPLYELPSAKEERSIPRGSYWHKNDNCHQITNRWKPPRMTRLSNQTSNAAWGNGLPWVWTTICAASECFKWRTWSSDLPKTRGQIESCWLWLQDIDASRDYLFFAPSFIVFTDNNLARPMLM